jgi:hypothetical protein
MALRLRWWLTAGSLVLGLAQAASAQMFYGPQVYRPEVLEVPLSARLLINFHGQPLQPCDYPAVPVSTRLLMTMHDQPAGSCADAAVPMSTLLLIPFRAQPAGDQIKIPTGAATTNGAGEGPRAPEPVK